MREPERVPRLLREHDAARGAVVIRVGAARESRPAAVGRLREIPEIEVELGNARVGVHLGDERVGERVVVATAHRVRVRARRDLTGQRVHAVRVLEIVVNERRGIAFREELGVHLVNRHVETGAGIDHDHHHVGGRHRRRVDERLARLSERTLRGRVANHFEMVDRDASGGLRSPDLDFGIREKVGSFLEDELATVAPPGSSKEGVGDLASAVLEARDVLDESTPERSGLVIDARAPEGGYQRKRRQTEPKTTKDWCFHHVSIILGHPSLEPAGSARGSKCSFAGMHQWRANRGRCISSAAEVSHE